MNIEELKPAATKLAVAIIEYMAATKETNKKQAMANAFGCVIGIFYSWGLSKKELNEILNELNKEDIMKKVKELQEGN